MTQRSIPAGEHPTVVIKSGASITVRGVQGDQVTATSPAHWGLKIEKRSAAELARARAAIGNFVLFEIRVKTPVWQEKSTQEVIEVQIGGSGEVLVPFGSNLKVYAGKDIDVQGISGQVDAYSGGHMLLKDVYCVGHASAGQTMNLDCQTLPGDDVKFEAGSDLRFHILQLTSAHIQVKDLGGFWEGRIGSGEKSIWLKSGGDVTLVTDQVVEALPPDFILGKVENPT